MTDDIKGIEISNIQITSYPQTEFFEGDLPSYTGLKLLVSLNNGVTYTIDEYDCHFSGFDSSAPTDNQVITVTYGGVSTEYSITIKERSTVDDTPVDDTPWGKYIGLSIKTLPKTEYKVGEWLSVEGGVLLAHYDSGRTKEVKMEFKHIYGFNNTEPGTYTITVKYAEDVVYFATYDITVRAEGDEPETKATIKAGTYRFNDALSAPSQNIEQSIHYNVTAWDGTIERGSGIRVSLATDDYAQGEVSVEYIGSEVIIAYEFSTTGWRNYYVAADVQTITFDVDQEVSDEFDAWFRVNAVPCTKVITAGTYRFNDVLSATSKDLYQSIVFSWDMPISQEYLDYEISQGYEVSGIINPTHVQACHLNVYLWDDGTTELQAYISETNSYRYKDGIRDWLPAKDYDLYIYCDGYGDEPPWWHYDMQTVTIDNDTIVSDEFYEWFTANTKPPLATIAHNDSTPKRMNEVWREPIFDRTSEDVEFAIRKIAEWKQSHTHSTDIRVEDDTLRVRDDGTAYVTDDKFALETEGIAYVENGVLVVRVGDVYELKGCFNLLDLNRIEGDIAFLAEHMEEFAYAPNIHGKEWNRGDMPNQNDMSRIVDNVRALIEAFYTPDNPPPLPSTMLSYGDINAIEENLYLLKQMLDCMQTSFKKVGTIKSGSRMLLPIRR